MLFYIPPSLQTVLSEYQPRLRVVEIPPEAKGF
jgi:hypothetical protein